MANHKNDHSHELTTTVAVREEVERALGSTIPANKRQEVVQRLEQVVERYSSPYPDANYLGSIEKLAPGITREILAASIDDVQHRRRMDERQLDLRERELSLVENISQGEFSSTRQGRQLGFYAYLALIIFSGVIYWLGSEKLALVAFGAAALGIINQLIRGGTGSAVTVTAEKVTDGEEKSGSKSVAKSQS